MIVVSDTTPLNYLLIIDSIDVLPALFQQVFVPLSVIVEMTHLKTPDVVAQWAKSPPVWIVVKSPHSRLASTVVLDSGEADALSLAKELGIRDVLIDERRGRKIAQREGLIPLPTLAVLERAAMQGLLELPTALAKLQQTNIRLSQKHIDAALARDTARKKQ